MNVVRLKKERTKQEIRVQGFRSRLYHDAVVVLELDAL